MAQEAIKLPANSYLICITQGHDSDLPILEAALQQPERFAFIGVIGSKQKASKLKRDLAERGVSEAAIENLAIPIGLPIGNNTPPEVAISVLSQLIQERDRLGIIDQRTKSF